MVDFGDEFLIQSSRIPWLIWIQILVLLLLFFLLYCFTLLTSDLSDSTTAFSASSSSSSSISGETHFGKSGFKQKNTTNCFQQASQVGDNLSIKGEIATGASGRVVRGEDIAEREGAPVKDANNIISFLHPCHYFRLAKLAFLKCLGLELDPSTSEQRNET